MEKFIKLITKNKLWFYIISILFIILTISNIYLIKTLLSLNNIENLIRTVAIITLILLLLLATFVSIKTLIIGKKKRNIFYIIVIIIYSAILAFVGYNIDKVYKTVDNISSNTTLYSSSIVTLKTNNVDNIKNIGNEKIGIYNDKNSIDGYQIPQEIIKNKKLNSDLEYYDSYISMINDLYNGNIKYIFLPSSYGVMFKNIDGLEEIEEKTKTIYTQKKSVTKKSTNKTTSIKKPFTLLLMGVDSEQEGIKGATFNGDALMLITFNPETLNTTILSIPRDTYVPIACFAGQRKNKITHAAWYGEDCMINTIENFTGITIDYYLKINFKGVVNLVNALGGVDVDVPFSFCEQNSNRDWGNNTIYVEKGQQTLNGEQALALARNRHPNPSMCSSKWTNYNSNDFVRGQNQQLIVKALLNKAKSINSLDTIYKLLDTISNNMETNMNTNEILSFYNIGKDILSKSKDTDIDQIIGMQRLYLSGYDKTIYDYSMINKQGTQLNLYNFVPYSGSINDVVSAMKVNLGLENESIIKNFSFDINNPYEENVIGKGTYHESAINLLPSFVGQKESVATSYGAKNNIKVNVNYVKSDNTNYFVGQIIKQDAPVGIDITYVNSFTITVVNKIISTETTTTSTNCALEENKDNSACQVKNFVGKSYSDYQTWTKNIKLSISFAYEEIKPGDDDYDASKKGIIISQSTTSGSLYSLIGNVLKVRYISTTDSSSTNNGTNENTTKDDKN